MSSSDGTAADASWERSDGRSRPPPTVNTIRRIRQACTNCRHRKTRCSGERPRCMNCRRVDRVCHYEPYSTTNPPSSASVAANNGAAKGKSPSSLFPRAGVVDISRLPLATRKSRQSSPSHRLLSINIRLPPPSPQTPFPTCQVQCMRFTTAPPPAVMDHLIDAYFLHVHNQPYSYFHEQSFRERVNYGLIPKCLLFAILASALKFSDIEYFQGSIREATEAYAREAWLAILHEHLTVENNPTLAERTLTLLTLFYIGGRTSSGWLKIGLAVRIAQDLQLMREPKNTMPPIEQEEHRRAFWSIYLLDKLVSVGQSRPPAIAEEDIHVQLPSDEETLRRGIWKKTPTLHQLINWKSETESSVNGTFTQTILAATALGRCCRYVLHGREMDEMPPWDPRSDFTLLNTFLLLIDHHLQVETPSIPQIVEHYRRPDGTLDFQSLEHVVFARIVFHTAHCLLNHPFLLRMRLQKSNCKVPPKFLTRSFQISCNHARSISSLVEDAIASGCHVQSSFYAYASILAGGILSLAIHIDQEKGQVTDPETLNHYQKAIHILERTGRRWDHASKMVSLHCLFRAIL
ncbi:hypothetical protein TRIATDRAFT_207590 [Trichoderma atroviride IMI 206040]|uniref:Zn(2)-C6 fungal-type domain-containing protein n=1 Tax=Hypocrea atroviridis (strain ATCC 20476 / IMI 206040) TaxID=452589 RepID=G9P8B9_HYPAI|nr:uncharacterized protein TRIATDRAFT_207590 [Trichoderma atroviride IMI 206040]EHK41752.1 hypothetical protein TRIATDRAFT_207590 [Trichoderma atroviride IMI 206040]